MLAEAISFTGFFNRPGGFSLDNNAAVYLMSHSKEKMGTILMRFVNSAWVRLERDRVKKIGDTVTRFEFASMSKRMEV